MLSEQLRSQKLDTNEVEAATTLTESVGVRFDGLAGIVGPTPSRDWKLDAAILGFCRRLTASGRELEILFGRIISERSCLDRCSASFIIVTASSGGRTPESSYL